MARYHRGERCKPGKEPKVGDEYVIRAGFDERTVVVLALSSVRRGAPEAQLLYREEIEESIARREQAAALRKAGALGCRPTGDRTRSSAGRFSSARLSTPAPPARLDGAGICP